MISTPASGCHCTPHTVGAKRAAWKSPAAVTASTTAPGGSSVTTSLFHCTARAGPDSGPSSASPAAASVQPTCSTPTCWPAGLGATAPPSATAATGGRGRRRAPAPRRPRPPGPRLLDPRQPGVLRVVVGAHRAAEHDHPRVRGQVLRQGVAGPGTPYVEGGGVGLPPLAQPPGRALGLVLDDQQRRSHTADPAGVRCPRGGDHDRQHEGGAEREGAGAAAARRPSPGPPAEPARRSRRAPRRAAPRPPATCATSAAPGRRSPRRTGPGRRTAAR